jgi:branched-chain amino acid transport system ATP-binding protein
VNALSVQEVCVQFGGVRALHRMSLEVPAGERRALLGPNGAGKTTLFNVIGGQTRADSGSVHVLGRNVTREPTRKRARAGLARTFQITKLFPALTVRENALLAVQAWHRGRMAMHRTAASYQDLIERVDRLLGEWKLADRADEVVRELSYGDQRQLEIVMALAHDPGVLLLDEPTAGLSAAETALVASLVDALPRSITLVFIEHDMDVAFGLADRITVMNQGSLLAEGSPQEIRGNAQIRELYFGALSGV